MTFAEFAAALDFTIPGNGDKLLSADRHLYIKGGTLFKADFVTIGSGNTIYKRWWGKEIVYSDIVNYLRTLNYNPALVYHRQRILKALIE